MLCLLNVSRFQIFCAHGGIPRRIEASVPQPVLAHYHAIATHAEVHEHAAAPVPPSTVAGQSSRSPRMARTTHLTPHATPAKGYTTPDLRLLAISKAQPNLKLLVIPPKPTGLLSSPMTGPLGSPSTPQSYASSVSAASGTQSPAPFASNFNTPSTFESLTAFLSEDSINRAAMDLLWADPASADTEKSGSLDERGFGPGLRGGDTFCFGAAAVEEFLNTFGFQASALYEL